MYNIYEPYYHNIRNLIKNHSFQKRCELYLFKYYSIQHKYNYKKARYSKINFGMIYFTHRKYGPSNNTSRGNNTKNFQAFRY